MPRELPEEPPERVRRRLVPREHQRRHLSGHFGVAEPRVRVLRRVRAHEEAHDVPRTRIVRTGGVRALLCADELRGDVVDYVQGATVARVFARGEVPDVVE